MNTFSNTSIKPQIYFAIAARLWWLEQAWAWCDMLCAFPIHCVCELIESISRFWCIELFKLNFSQHIFEFPQPSVCFSRAVRLLEELSKNMPHNGIKITKLAGIRSRYDRWTLFRAIFKLLFQTTVRRNGWLGKSKVWLIHSMVSHFRHRLTNFFVWKPH